MHAGRAACMIFLFFVAGFRAGIDPRPTRRLHKTFVGVGLRHPFDSA
jgi:hypothetical protein